MSAINDLRSLMEQFDSADDLCNNAILELDELLEKETIHRRKDTLDLLSTIAGVEERIAKRLDELDARVKELKDSLAEHRDWHRAGGLIPKPTPVLNDAKPTHTDEELVSDIALRIFQEFRKHGEVSGVDFNTIRSILRQLIAEVRT